MAAKKRAKKTRKSSFDNECSICVLKEHYDAGQSVTTLFAVALFDGAIDARCGGPFLCEPHEDYYLRVASCALAGAKEMIDEKRAAFAKKRVR